MRSVVKHRYIKVGDKGKGRLRAHLNYIQFRPGRDEDEDYRLFFNGKHPEMTGREVQRLLDSDSRSGVLVHKLILSPGHNDIDMQDYTKTVLAEFGRKKGLELNWAAIEHTNTAHHHAHVVISGRDANGHTVFIRKDDHTLLRSIGDRYIERDRHLRAELEILEQKLKDVVEKARDDQPASHSEMFSRFVDRFSNNAKSLVSTVAARHEPSWQMNWLERHYRWNAERAARIASDPIGTPPPRNFEQQKPQPTQITWHKTDTSTPWDRVVVSKNSSLKELRNLLHDCRKEGPPLPTEDFKELMGWIREKESEDEKLDAKARDLSEIVIDTTESGSFSKEESTSESLKWLADEHKIGRVALQEHEFRALKLWLKERRPRKGKKGPSIDM